MYYLKRFFQIFWLSKQNSLTFKQSWIVALFQIKFEMYLFKNLKGKKFNKFTVDETIDLLNKYYPFDNIKDITIDTKPINPLVCKEVDL